MDNKNPNNGFKLEEGNVQVSCGCESCRCKCRLDLKKQQISDLTPILVLNKDAYGKIIDDLNSKIMKHEYQLQMDEVIVATRLLTGIRKNELAALKWGDLENLNPDTPDSTIIHICSRIERSANGKHNIWSNGCDARRFVIPDFSAKILLDWKKECAENGRSVADKSFVFAGRSGAMISTYQLGKYERRYLEQLGLAEASFPNLRHTFICACLDAGIDTEVLEGILGKSTMRWVNRELEKFKAWS